MHYNLPTEKCTNHKYIAQLNLTNRTPCVTCIHMEKQHFLHCFVARLGTTYADHRRLVYPVFKHCLNIII